MAFTANINSITPGDNGQGGVQFLVAVAFADSTSGFVMTKTYAFPANSTQAAAVAQITTDGQAYKSALATLSNLQAKVGTIITI